MLSGFAVDGFRSFGTTPQVIAPLSKINIFVGKNNCGKSNILRVLPLLARFAADRKTPTGLNTSLDFHRGKRPATPHWGFAILTDDASLAALMKRLAPSADQSSRWMKTLEGILKSLPTHADDKTWFTFDPMAEGQLISPTVAEVIRTTPRLPGQQSPQLDWTGLWRVATERSGGSFEQHHVPDLLGRFARLAVPDIAQVHQIDAHRQIGAPGSPHDGLNGSGLIARLLELQNPELSKRNELQKFLQINQFIKTVTGSADARLEIPHSGKELLVELDGRVLPIQSLGTGIQEVVIFAAAATSIDNAILCIEEPEIHLHPRLQRKLLEYLQDQTTNQYFITTHSASLLDAPGIASFHVRLNADGESEVELLDVPGKRAAVGKDLGYRASDLVQANAIIWVEGPSDRIYVNAWLNSVAPELEEGLHYSVMFYGGRLLAHLTADDSSVSQFISLQRLNRHVAIVFDSDKRAAKSRLNATKKRVIDEIDKHGGFAWVTFGREIENYVSAEVMSAALAFLHPKMSFANDGGEWSCRYEPTTGERSSVDKIALASRVIKAVDLGVLDLAKRVTELANFIRRANA